MRNNMEAAYCDWTGSARLPEKPFLISSALTSHMLFEAKGKNWAKSNTGLYCKSVTFVSDVSTTYLPPIDFLASGAQNTPSDICTHGKGTCHCGEEDFAEEDLKNWELSGGTHCPPREQTADLFSEDWDLELKADQGNPYDADDIQGSISQEIKPWVRCAPQGDMVYDPSWHHPPPLIPHYSKMVFETGQFDDAED
ncbi:coordinator of PRMT5 and differentiation stimulator [Thomomys bottae]